MSARSPHPRMRAVLAVTIVQLLTIALWSAPTDASARETELPIFTSSGPIVDADDSPTGEFIFPSAFHAGKHLQNPLGEWYIYYAPHDPPAGIYLMYADSLQGPWKQHPGNPIITNVWEPHYDVSHTSSPDAFWSDVDDELFLYFHGENTEIRYATSTDGVNFEYGDKVVTTSMIPDATETSYERVFRNPDKDSDYPYAMFFMVNNTANTRKIHVARSKDLRSWDVDTTPLVTPGDAEGANVSAANLWKWKGEYYILYGATTGTIFARTVSKDLTSVGEPRPLYSPSAIPPEAGRATSPEIIQEGRNLHLFYEFGARGQTTVGHAILDPEGVRDPLNSHPDDPTWEKCPGAGSDEFAGNDLDREVWPTILREEDSRHAVAEGSLHLPHVCGLGGHRAPHPAGPAGGRLGDHHQAPRRSAVRLPAGRADVLWRSQEQPTHRLRAFGYRPQHRLHLAPQRRGPQ